MFKKENPVEKKQNRFEVIFKESVGTFGMEKCEILLDKVTGVNYLSWANGEGGCGLTPLLDSDGKAVVTLPETKD